MLHRNDAPFCAIVTIEQNGVGILGRVWTNPVDRRQSAASQLLQLLMADFQARGERALYLSAAYDGAPYHIYRAHGFSSIENQSGMMAFFRAGCETFSRLRRRTK